MRVGEAFPSKYLGADDLQGRPAVVRIDTVFTEVIENKQKLIVAFSGKRKTMVCNKTNAEKIAEVLRDDETDNWTGQMIELYPAEVDFQGKTVPAIRVRAPQRASNGGQQRTETTSPQPRQAAPSRNEYADQSGGYQQDPPPRREAPQRVSHDMDDDIPF